MLNSIVNTIGSKGAIASINLLLAILYSRFLGSSTYGYIAIINLIVHISCILNGIVTGNSLVFYANSFHKKVLFIYIFTWITLSTGILLISALVIKHYYSGDNLVLQIIPIIPALVFLTSSTAAFQNFLLGRGKIKHYNTFSIILPISHLITSLIIIFILNIRSLYTFIISICFATIVTLFITSSTIIKIVEPDKSQNNPIKRLITNGIKTQFGQIVQILNDRISYFIIIKYISSSSLGIFNLALQLVESLKIVSISTSTALLSSLTNTKSKTSKINKTITCSKYILILLSTASILLFIIPDTFYSFIFGTEYSNLKWIMITLLLAAFSDSISLLFKAYFFGVGAPSIVLITNTIGLIIIATTLFPLINTYRIFGVGVSYSFSCLFSLIFLYHKFVSTSNNQFNDFLPQKKEFEQIRDFLIKTYKRFK